VITAVATIALGLGIDTALFTVFNAYYFAPVSVRDPYSLYAIGRRGGTRGARVGGAHGYSWAEYQEFLTQNPAFSEAFGYRGAEARMNDRRAFGLLVTGDYFRVLGGRPVLGRTLLDENASSIRSEPVLVLSFSANWLRVTKHHWKRHTSTDTDTGAVAQSGFGDRERARSSLRLYTQPVRWHGLIGAAFDRCRLKPEYACLR
jgi:hypothetical protein